MSDRTAILVTGSRDWRDYGTIHDRLSLYPPGTILIHGDCGRYEDDPDPANTNSIIIGADWIADEIGRGLNFTIWPLPYFGDLEKRGGPVRNESMVDVLAVLNKRGFRCAVEGFPMGPSYGTRGCLRYAHKISLKIAPSSEPGADGAFRFHVTEGVANG